MMAAPISKLTVVSRTFSNKGPQQSSSTFAGFCLCSDCSATMETFLPAEEPSSTNLAASPEYQTSIAWREVGVDTVEAAEDEVSGSIPALQPEQLDGPGIETESGMAHALAQPTEIQRQSLRLLGKIFSLHTPVRMKEGRKQRQLPCA